LCNRVDGSIFPVTDWEPEQNKPGFIAPSRKKHISPVHFRSIHAAALFPIPLTILPVTRDIFMKRRTAITPKENSGTGISPVSGDIEPSPGLLGDLRTLIESARIRVAVGVNTEMVLLYWDIGERIRTEILCDERAEYGKRVVTALSDQLSGQYGPGFKRTNLFNMIRFAEVFPDRSIVHSLSGQLSWTHFRNIIYIDDNLAREFYTEKYWRETSHWQGATSSTCRFFLQRTGTF
jgi:hypothetical protein